MNQRWRSAAPDDLAWLDWNDSSVVYHRPSGKTHFVNIATRSLLRDVLASPQDEQSASRALAEESGLEQQPLLEHLHDLLLRLEQLGLVERAST